MKEILKNFKAAENDWTKGKTGNTTPLEI